MHASKEGSGWTGLSCRLWPIRFQLQQLYEDLNAREVSANLLAHLSQRLKV